MCTVEPGSEYGSKRQRRQPWTEAPLWTEAPRQHQGQFAHRHPRSFAAASPPQTNVDGLWVEPLGVVKNGKLCGGKPAASHLAAEPEVPNCATPRVSARTASRIVLAAPRVIPRPLRRILVTVGGGRLARYWPHNWLDQTGQQDIALPADLHPHSLRSPPRRLRMGAHAAPTAWKIRRGTRFPVDRGGDLGPETACLLSQSVQDLPGVEFLPAKSAERPPKTARIRGGDDGVQLTHCSSHRRIHLTGPLPPCPPSPTQLLPVRSSSRVRVSNGPPWTNLVNLVAILTVYSVKEKWSEGGGAERPKPANLIHPRDKLVGVESRRQTPC